MTAESARRAGFRSAAKWLVLAAAAALLFAPLPRFARAGWRSELLDCGHVPLFALIVVAIHAMFPRSLLRPVLAAIALAGLVEAVQPLAGRSAGSVDFLYGTLGALAGMGSIVCVRQRRVAAIVAALAFIGLCLAWPVSRSGPVLLDAWEGARDFPTLAHFRTRRELHRWELRQAQMLREPDPQRPGEWTARLTFHPGPEPYPSAILAPIRRDFSAVPWLCVEFEVEGRPLELVVSIRGGPDDSGHTSHVQFAKRCEPGPQVIRVYLPAAAPQAQPRPLDLADIWYVQLFVVKPYVSHTIRLRRVWLEP